MAMVIAHDFTGKFAGCDREPMCGRSDTPAGQ